MKTSTNMNTQTTVWLRAESKPFEQRTPLTPAHAATLVESGLSVFVERGDTRVFPNDDYVSAGCSLVAAGSWESAPIEAFILGLKELPESDQPLRHRHIYFAHAFKEQAGWQDLLQRFRTGGGGLYDLEYLLDSAGRRVAAFGYWAGFAGAAVAAMAWSGQQADRHPVLGPLAAYANKLELIEHCRQQLRDCGELPRVIVIGAAGRCGGGATELFRALGASITLWDLAETKDGGPFEQILEHDVFVNCVYVSRAIPPFLTSALLERSRRLTIVCDVSCDPSGDLNPLPIYNRCTSFADPTQRVVDGENALDVIAIDNLPSLLPKESSEDFSNSLVPHLLGLGAPDEGVWVGARRTFGQHCQRMTQPNHDERTILMSAIHWLGAGLSSVPGIRRLATSGRPFVLWNRTLSKAQAAMDGCGEARELDWDGLATTVQSGDVVVSMLPADLHLRVAELCLKRGLHFISSSYVSPAMQALDASAKANGLRFVNEVGLDPGIDHLMAHLLMDDYRKSGVMSPGHEHHFRSFCGGFPSQPNDFRYKFSWSPLGVLRALKTPARWIEDGVEKTTETPWKSLSQYAVDLPSGAETFQAYPNRDSIPFAEQYGVDANFKLQTFVRGTLRLAGWAEAWQDIFDVVEADTTDENQLKQLSDSLWSQYAYDPDEPDRVILHVELTVEDNGQTVWSGAYVLDEHGNVTGSAMARLVSKTVSIAVESLLDGELEAGVSAAPSNRQTAESWLKKLIASGETIVRK